MDFRRINGLPPYVFATINDLKAAARHDGRDVIDMGFGNPDLPSPDVAVEKLAEAARNPRNHRYSSSAGIPKLRLAVSNLYLRRFGVELDPDTEIVPTLGSKEAIYSLAQVMLDPAGGKDLVVVTEPGYPVQERGALFAGGRVLSVPLLERNAFLPDLDAIPAEEWPQIAVFWVNYPNNPTGAVAPLSFFERLAALAVEHDFLLASDEAYTELYFSEPPPSALQLPSRRNVAVFNTLSKRSSMTGYRSGFVAGDPELIAALRLFRPTVGTAPQEFVQHAAIAAWGDEAHVARTREAYGRKRELLLEVLGEKGIRVAASEATMYLWLEVPGGGASEAFAAELLEHGIVVAPGAFFGPAGEGYVRIALVPTEDECRRAAAILREVL